MEKDFNEVTSKHNKQLNGLLIKEKPNYDHKFDKNPNSNDSIDIFDKTSVTNISRHTLEDVAIRVNRKMFKVCSHSTKYIH